MSTATKTIPASVRNDFICFSPLPGDVRAMPAGRGRRPGTCWCGGMPAPIFPAVACRVADTRTFRRLDALRAACVVCSNNSRFARIAFLRRRPPAVASNRRLSVRAITSLNFRAKSWDNVRFPCIPNYGSAHHQLRYSSGEYIHTQSIVSLLLSEVVCTRGIAQHWYADADFSRQSSLFPRCKDRFLLTQQNIGVNSCFMESSPDSLTSE